VASPRMVQELTELTGFVEDMRVLGRTPTARVLSREVIPVAPLLAERLAVPAGTTIVQIRRSDYRTACRPSLTRPICRRHSAAR
jgi:GntR family transcriptional regulator